MKVIFSILFSLQVVILPAQIVVGTLAGNRDTVGYDDGLGIEATFNNPHGIAISQKGNIYICDRFNHLIRKITPEGLVTTLAGNPGVIGDADGVGTAALFYEPWGICVDQNENVFIADTRNNKIKKIDSDGVVSTYAGTGNYGTTNGPVDVSTFGMPVGIEIDDEGNIYVADHATHIIRKISNEGFVTTLAGIAYTPGDEDGNGLTATFNRPYGLTLDLNGDILVADEWNHKIRRITTDGQVSTVAGTGDAGGDNGEGANATFYYPWDIAVDSFGVIFVADGLNSVIRKIIPDGNSEVSTYVGEIGEIGNLDGIGNNASFSGVTSMAFSPLSRELYVTDAYNNLIRSITDLASGVYLHSGNDEVSICQDLQFEVKVYPIIFDQFQFYLDDVLVEETELPRFDSLGISPGTHTLRVVAIYDSLAISSVDFVFGIIESLPPSIDIIGGPDFFEGDSAILISSLAAEYYWSNGATTPTITVFESGIYFVEIIDENGCNNFSSSVEIIIRPIPEAISIAVDGSLTFCDGERVELISSQAENNQWLKDGWPIEEAVSTVLIVKESGVYQVRYTDDFGTVVLSDAVEIEVFPLPELGFRADKTVVKPGEEIKFYTPDEGLISVEWDFGNTGSASNFSTDFAPVYQYSEEGIYDVSLSGTNEKGCVDTLYKPDFITVSRNADTNLNNEDVFVATAFTPNDDGINDFLYVRGSDIQSVQLKIFNQKGGLVFESSSKEEGWNGFYKNVKAPIGNYVYQLNYVNLFGEERKLSGVVTLLK